MSYPSDRFQSGAFELHVAARELRKDGVRLRIQDKPLELLRLLLERPGEVVSREAVRQALWPADTFVDFDHSLGTALNKLRTALGDSARNPLFIETVANHGYKFIAPVLTPRDEPVSVDAPAVQVAAPAPAGAWRTRTIALTGGLAAGAALVAIVLGF